MKAKMLEGQTAIVTGATKGIGRAIAELYLQEGANVVITARDQEDIDQAVAEMSKDGQRVIGIVGDNADPDAPERVFEKAIETFGQVDIMVNNAAVRRK